MSNIFSNRKELLDSSNAKNRRSILIRCIILGIAFFPFLVSSKIIGNEIIHHVLMVISALIITTDLLIDAKFIKINLPIIILFLFSFYTFFISIYNGVLSFGVTFSIYFIFVSILYIIKSYYKKDYLFIKVISAILNVLLLINFPSVISSIPVPEYDKIFLLGGKNAMSTFVISTIFFNYLNASISLKRLSRFDYFMTIVGLATLLLSGSSTGIILGIIMSGFLFFTKFFKIKPIIYITIFAAALILIFNTELLAEIPIIKDYITDTLNKDLTFTGRTNIWKYAGDHIADNFWGYGRGNEIIKTFTGATNECHNSILELLLASGVPGLFLFIWFFTACVFIKKKYRERDILNVCYFVLFSFMILGLTESRINDLTLWWIIAITFCEGKSQNKNITLKRRAT